MFGFKRVACAVPECRVADPFFNMEKMAECASHAVKKGSGIILFPELAISSASCQDLFLSSSLLQAGIAAAEELLERFRKDDILLIFGCPFLSSSRKLYNGVIAARKGEVLAALTLPPPGMEEGNKVRGIPFASGRPEKDESLFFAGRNLPLSPAGETILAFPEGRVGICSSRKMGMQIASAYAPEILLHLMSGNFPAGKRKVYAEYFKVESSVNSSLAAGVFAGCQESSADGTAPGFAFIAENGEVLNEHKGHCLSSVTIYGDMDWEAISFRRRKENASPLLSPPFLLTFNESMPLPHLPLERKISATPFIPEGKEEAEEYFREIFAIQTSALAKRLTHTGMKSLVLGLSGGLDSTLALLAAVETFTLLQWDKSNIHIVTMPGFGTSSRTKENAVKMAELSGGTLHTVSIAEACLQHFSDIGHDPSKHDLTYENSQARERTQILMDMANMHQALVLGTGDLSEIALGWCTYNGDHMSMYGINGSIPKTLMRNMVLSFAASHKEWKSVLEDVVATPVSPELLPPDENGEIAQKTENVLGSYELHDFYLYHLVKNGASPEKILFLAKTVFAGKYPEEEIGRTLSLFLRRFFTQQFKRSCMPEGPGASGITLSPRCGDFVMPSDAAMTLFKL